MRLEFLKPDQVVDSMEQIDLDELYAHGIRGLILDLDNTITAWHTEEISPERMAWLKRAEKRFGIVILSNTFFGRRLKRIARYLGCEYLAVWHFDRKPRRHGFRHAMRLLGTETVQTAMIGDQLLADILGARRTGVYSIWVRPISKHEFFATRLLRILERACVRRMCQRGLLPERTSEWYNER